MCTILYVDEARSTNTLLAQNCDSYGHGTAVAARVQTAGRGQRGNCWESEPYRNLTFSLLLRPSLIEAARQFELSQIVAISIAKVLRRHLNTDEIRIKWPNDIYYRDLKICGILIENSLVGSRIGHSVVGIGVNVNQRVFRSDAPNPVSMVNIAGHEFDLDPLLEDFVCRIVDDFDAYERHPEPESLASLYRSMLWRADGFWPYRDNLQGDTFMGRIAVVSPIGQLTLETESGQGRTFAFKEVSALL